MIDRLLSMLVGAALLGVLVFDSTFLENVFHAFGEPTVITSVGIWEVSVAGILATLIVAALVMDRRRP